MRPVIPAVAAAAVLVLAGCSEPEPGSPLPTGGGVATSAAPNAAPSATSSATPSTGGAETTAEVTATATAEPSAAPTAAPTLPPEATTNDAAGAEAFVKYYYELTDYAIVTGDTSRLAATSQPTCQTCSTLISVIDDRYASGGYFEGGQTQLSDVVSPQPSGDGRVVAAFALDQEAPIAFDVDGQQVSDEVATPETSYLQIDLHWLGEAWSVSEVAP